MEEHGNSPLTPELGGSVSGELWYGEGAFSKDEVCTSVLGQLSAVTSSP